MKKVIRNIIFYGIIFLTLIFLSKTTYSQSNPLNNKISISVSNTSLKNALNIISKKTGICFSFNSDILSLDSTVSLSLTNKTISKVLYHLIGKNYYLKTLGNHIIILKRDDAKINNSSLITINGYITNAETGEILPNVTIYDLNKNYSALSDSNGYFKIRFIPETETIGLGFSKNKFSDTIVFIKSAITSPINISLHLNSREIENIEKLQLKQPKIISSFNINDLGIVKSFVRADMLIHAKNLNIYETRTGQFSILPYIGTNRKISGAIVNRISFNAIAGYSNGVNGVELGTLLNISKNDVKGFQFSGFGNITQGKTKGFQVASVFNRNIGNVSGLQLSGLSNIVLDTLKGVQIGFVNYVRVNKGFQFGIINMVDSSSGVSIGFISVAKKGYYNLSVFTDEMLMPNIAFKMGTNKFYNIWGLSAEKDMWGLTYGFGIHPKPEKKYSFNYDFSLTQMSYKKPFEVQFCMKTKLLSDLNIKLGKRFDLFTGLSLNVFCSDKLIDLELQDHITNITNSFISTTTFKSVRMQIWPGLEIGIKYRL